MVFERLKEGLSEITSKEYLVAAGGTVTGIVAGSVIVKKIVDDYFKMTGTQAIVAKAGIRAVLGAWLVGSGRVATTTGIFIKSAGIGMLAGILLDLAERYGFAMALEKTLSAVLPGGSAARPVQGAQKIPIQPKSQPIRVSQPAKTSADKIVAELDFVR